MAEFIFPPGSETTPYSIDQIEFYSKDKASSEATRMYFENILNLIIKPKIDIKAPLDFEYAPDHNSGCCQSLNTLPYKGEVKYNVFLCKSKGMVSNPIVLYDQNTGNYSYLNFEDIDDRIELDDDTNFWPNLKIICETTYNNDINKHVSDKVSKAFLKPLNTAETFKGLNEANGPFWGNKPVDVTYDLIPNEETKPIDVNEIFKAQFNRKLKV